MLSIFQKQNHSRNSEQLFADRYKKLIKLGEGTYGDVSKCLDQLTNKTVALKKIKILEENEGIPSTALREISILKELIHPNIVQLLDIYNDTKKLYLVFEYCKTDLHKFIKEKQSLNITQLSSSTVIDIMTQILRGISYMHGHRILHRDIKPSNILMDGSTIKIADFGLSRSIGIPIKIYTLEVVTMWYRPPELITTHPVAYSSAIDMWAIGCVFAELLTLGKPLFNGDSDIDQLHKIIDILGFPNEEEMKILPQFSFVKKQHYKPRIHNESVKRIYNLNGSAKDLLMKFFCYLPGRRISAREALTHPYLTMKE